MRWTGQARQTAWPLPLYFGPMRSLVWSLWCLPLLLACARPASAPAPAPGVTEKAGTPPISRQISEAASAPLNDLNLLHAKIPEVLLAAQQGPYAPPVDPGCDGLAQAIRQLDAALGPDLDAPSTPGNPSMVDKGRSEAGEAAVGALRHTAEGLIPFRGWVRKLSGAERYSKQVLEAITAGIVRRAYLKGLRQAQGCPVPAAPFQPSPEAGAAVSPRPVEAPPSR